MSLLEFTMSVIMSPATTLERHVRLVSNFVYNKLQPSVPSSTTTIKDLCHTKQNQYCQQQCNGCGEICELLRWGELQRRRDSSFQGCSPQSRTVHHSYLELDYCARASSCDTCRTIRRAFLLEQITGRDVERLTDPDDQGPIHAKLSLRPSGDVLLLTCRPKSNKATFTATIALNNHSRHLPDDPTRRGARLLPDWQELQRVVQDCHQNHECSSRYRWSHRNPTWLVEIQDNNHIRLVRGPETLVSYVVLSYSWGDPTEMDPAEWARIKGAGTKTKDGIPVPERLNPFPVWELPETMQDAIKIAKTLGFHYIWIDNVCIPKGTNWDTEASLMHEVYGNAAFTLVASSSTKATDRLIVDRLAWSHRSKAVKLRGKWLHNTQMPLDKVRQESPVARRSWTLQEERLSPRVLYWTRQRWYWSCPESQMAELKQLGHPRRDSHEDGAQNPERCPQLFLELCRTGDIEQLHEEWLDIVESYTPRDLVEPRDRFLAISGLAVRFYSAKAEAGGSFISEEYLAGLWKDNFARHLTWSVVKAAPSEHTLQHIAPSWSWASLPLRMDTKTKHTGFKLSEHFKFISVIQEQNDGAKTLLNSDKIKQCDSLTRGRAVEERGRGVKVVEVEGRFRRFISESAREQESWEALEWKRGDRTGFNFTAFPGQDLYARHRMDGRIISKDAHSGEIIGQLDYLAPLSHGFCSQTKPYGASAPFVPYGRENEIVCLELGESAMLLLVRNRKCPGGHQETYRRVGVAIGYTNRKGFFYGCETKRLRLA
ncbi:putative Het protein [Podospora australis]|uniref:Het protein n=1 Tax=Podospora australis TaxID=1536484 RepID=A0AAN7ACU8_9PEZI|nr:putative Het protein [Podospora australis]